LLQKKKLAITISLDEYVQLTAALGPVLDDPRILLFGSPNNNQHFVQGFGSIYEKLTNKLSHAYEENFNLVEVFVFIKDQKNAEYYQIINKQKIFKNTDYQDVINGLRLSEYEQVNYVEEINQFCIKGGIIDVYSPLYSKPFRLCLYEEDRSIKFYNIVSGLSEQKEHHFIYLNQQDKKVNSFNILNFLNNKKIIISLASPKLMGGAKIISYYSLVNRKNNKPVLYSDKIYFSGYKYKGEIVAPLIYKNQNQPLVNTNNPVLEVGDYVCHEDYGVGILKGFVPEHTKYADDSLKIQYQDGQVLLSTKNLHKISIVSRETENEIKINSLSKPARWKTAKKSITSSIENYVTEIINLYQEKQNVYREPFLDGGDLEEAFINNFQHVDTADQTKVWAEIKKDLESEAPMYRLLCGDVGFGKTELAIRAVFRVVLNGKQAVVLVPTAVLAAQHYKVFVSRMQDFGVNVNILTSSTTTKEKTHIKTDWIEGSLDVLIGTTAIIYDHDFIKFSSLFIVDEEHRFGVKDKEITLNYFSNKDVLFMSATPIPRSLNLSLSGVHSISTLSTPPILRLPIQTFIVYFEKQVIKRAVDFELSRKGQVFYVHNEISSINSVSVYLKALCPYISIEIAHSKVPAKTLKKRVLDFVNGNINVLLCTSIIGSGIDIPNANTIIINRAHFFGLAQLHQIRGRVGRSHKQAFAYLMVSKGAKITDKGKKRLKTISKHTSLGSGYYIAKSDMKIRGGGLVFGYKQSGSFFNLGYDYYVKLVSQKISEKINENFIFYVNKFVYKVDFVCVFSNTYIPANNQRLSEYKNLGELYSIEKIKQHVISLANIYGPLPSASKNLINLRFVTVYAGFLKLISLTCLKNTVVFIFDDKFKETSELFNLLKNKQLDSFVDEYYFKVVKNATSLELVINKGVILDGLYLKVLLERLYGYVKK